MLFSILDHAIDLFIRQSAGRLDDDGLFLARRLVFRTHIHDAIRVDIEGDFNLWHTAWRWWNIGQIKSTK